MVSRLKKPVFNNLDFFFLIGSIIAWANPCAQESPIYKHVQVSHKEHNKTLIMILGKPALTPKN